MSEDRGPRCPGCGYAIFGIRDMRCPECGRTLDVRDFNPDGVDRSAARYERDSAIGGVIGAGIVLLILAPFMALTVALASSGAVVGGVLIITIILLFWFLGTASAAGRGVAEWIKGRRKRRD
jgi:DNA-directed RNA polymerase subunit RPC12/RpoP